MLSEPVCASPKLDEKSGWVGGGEAGTTPSFQRARAAMPRSSPPRRTGAQCMWRGTVVAWTHILRRRKGKHK